MGRGRWALVLLALSAALAGCGGGDDDSSKTSGSGNGGEGGGGADCKDADQALTDAARLHVANLKVAEDGGEGEGEGVGDRITVNVCRTTEEDATAEVVVYGMRDDSVRDVRHRLRLIKVGGLWQVTDDVDATRCQPGRGHQDFSGDTCV
jgi:hypothetical protein